MKPEHNLLFKILSEKYQCHTDLINEIIGLVKVQKIPKGTILLNKGAFEASIRFVNAGLICAYSETIENNHITWFSKEGYFACDIESLLAKKTSQYTIKVLENSTLLYISAENMFSLLSKYQEANKLSANLIGDYINNINKKTLILGQPTVTKKYESFLQAFPSLSNRLKQSEIANYLQVHATTLSNIRGKKA